MTSSQNSPGESIELDEHSSDAIPSESLLGEVRHDLAAIHDMQTLSQLGGQGPAIAKLASQSSVGQDHPVINDGQHRNWLSLWWLEVLAASFSLVCLLVTIGVLRVLDGKQYESWRVANVDITPNTLVSVLATFSKSSLLLPVAEGISQLKWLFFQHRAHRSVDMQVFDDASRGPLGSVHLLWSLNTHALVASLGAIITTLALATDPFTQQILVYRTRPALASNVSASISASSVLNVVDQFRDLTSGESNTYVFLQQMQLAMMSAITQPAANTQYECPSGSCTWPVFSSLGLCNSCTDISHEAKVTCENINDPSTLLNPILCTYTLPAEQNLNSAVNGTLREILFWSLWTNPDNREYSPLTYFNVSVDPNQSAVTPIGVFAVVTSMRFNTTYNSTSPNAPADILPIILRCNVTWCAQTHASSRFESGALHDFPTSSVPLYVDGSNCSSAEALLCPGYPSDEHPATPEYYAATSEPKATAPYWISTELAESVAMQFASALQTELFSALDLFWLDKIAEQVPPSYAVDYETASNGSGNDSPAPWLLYWGNNGNLSETLDNSATSMTNIIRKSSYSTTVKGTVMIPTVYVHVKWPWLIYPTALSVLAGAFLMMTIHLSHGRDKLVWKSSSPALLFHGLRSGDEREMSVQDARAMEKMAEEISPRLIEDDTGKIALRSS